VAASLIGKPPRKATTKKVEARAEAAALTAMRRRDRI
jgi:hypothetical protein